MEAQKCPVCLGTGEQKAGFYQDKSTRCKACASKGYLLVPKSPPQIVNVPSVWTDVTNGSDNTITITSSLTDADMDRVSARVSTDMFNALKRAEEKGVFSI